jgi:hypothetical protein
LLPDPTVSRRLRQGALAGAVTGLALMAAPAGFARDPIRLEWRRLAATGAAEAVAALAVDARGARLAVGDARGVRLRRDLAFLPEEIAPEGGLLVATEVGLYRVEADGRRAPSALAPGDAARNVHRISVSRTAVAVATDAGAFLSTDARRWQRVAAALPVQPAVAVAMREAPSGLECFAVVEGRLWQVRLLRAGDGWSATHARRETIPFSGGSQGPVDVVFGADGADVVVVFPAAFAVRGEEGGAWRVVTPSLPPEVRARRLLVAHGRLWLATDRGLLVAQELAGPWRRAAAPAGTADVRAVASDAASLYAAAGDRVLVARAGAGAAAAPRLRTVEGDPPVEQVQRAALRHLALEPGRIAALRAGVGRRGWLPIFTVRTGLARDRDSSVDHDESFTSGALRHLVDRDRQRHRDLAVSATLSWDFGDVAYHPEQIDVSREARELIKLRDDVLDELTQLYFDRRRVLAELAARPDAPPSERLELRLRAAELAAGIDAWTGGWFSRSRLQP